MLQMKQVLAMLQVCCNDVHWTLNLILQRDDEFDTSLTYLGVVPGMEGHHGRFRVLCERLKLPALVLQLGLDDANETIQETAQRLTEVG